jgi:hypothetical protein
MDWWDAKGIPPYSLLRPARRAPDIGAPFGLGRAEQGLLARRVAALLGFEHEAAALVEVDAAVGRAVVGVVMEHAALIAVGAARAARRVRPGHAQHVA